MDKLFCRRLVCLKLFRKHFSSVQVPLENSLRKLPFKNSFVQSLIAGKYDCDFLIYPELKSESVKRVESKYLALPKELTNFRQSLSSLEKISSADDILENRENTVCELTRLSEAIKSPSLAILTEIHNICVQNIVSKYCTEDQKKKYLPGLLRGETSVAFALSEEVSGSDPSCINTFALRDRGKTTYSANGVKTWVTNAESADLFFVFSKIKLHEKINSPTELAVLIIEKDTPGVSVEKIPSFGLQDCGIGNLILNNVKLNEDCIVGKVNNNGYDIATEFLSSFKYSYSAFFSSQLKSLLRDTIQFISPRKQTLFDLKDTESVMKKLSDVFLTIYTLDSMLYLTAGLKDRFDVDLSLESAVIYLFCIQNGMEAVDKCMEMLGSRAFDESLPYYKLRNDLKASTNVFHSKDICKYYIALNGILKALTIINKDVSRMRNALNYPFYFFKDLLNSWRDSRDSPRLNLKLYMNLHPSLKNASDELEYTVVRFKSCIEKLLVVHGSELSKRQLNLERVSDILVGIYSMTAVLGRSSRAYCTGVRYADDELLAAKSVCINTGAKIKSIINDIRSDDAVFNDLFHLKIAGHLFNHKGYFIEHPLTQNID